MAEWKYYVYALTDGDEIVYIGKGSGNRLTAQRRNHKCDGYELARCKCEKDAYALEVDAIAQYKPGRNKNRGGAGSYSTHRPKQDWEIRAERRWQRFQREIDAVGSRRYCARFLLSKDLSSVYPPSELDEIRRQLAEVWNGPRC